MVTRDHLVEIFREMISVLERFVGDPALREQITAEWNLIPERVLTPA